MFEALYHLDGSSVGCANYIADFMCRCRHHAHVIDPQTISALGIFERRLKSHFVLIVYGSQESSLVTFSAASKYHTLVAFTWNMNNAPVIWATFDVGICFLFETTDDIESLHEAIFAYED